MTNYYTGSPAIYGLYGPDGRAFYVGRTSRSVRARWYEHKYRAPWHPGPVYEKWRELGEVTIRELEAGDDPTRELYWTDLLRSEGNDLVNQLGANGNPYAWSEDSKEKVGRANRGKTTWIKGKTGEAAGWTQERREQQAERIRQVNERRKAVGG